MKILEGLSDHLFASAQLVAHLHRENDHTHFPSGILAEVLWLDAGELTQIYGDTLTASEAVTYVRRSNPNHILLTIMNGGNDRG
ncbi:hypothetical protein J7E93_09405 [Streptomyces sp. ISL-36]|uniref:hypothetical protein n=1 Tax=Streptomyces sp. ISL-36 TaxID=2819182 RepID=UPI001BEA2443|nr:hypothetical protein [Streptomyces sp. ISL-36]MBT2440321.1 hypothetical protein [Streptomyces sp. ISL-36]